jgi:hypothetical protein
VKSITKLGGDTMGYILPIRNSQHDQYGDRLIKLHYKENVVFPVKNVENNLIPAQEDRLNNKRQFRNNQHLNNKKQIIEEEKGKFIDIYI